MSSQPPIAWIDGEYKPIAETSLHVFDRGIVHGAAVTEMLRTFRHRPFRVEQHLERLCNSLDGSEFSPLRFQGEIRENH